MKTRQPGGGNMLRQRLHQRAFRERVLKAYRNQCSFCRLRHQELLDAAHIVPGAEPEGEPVIPNGLALCKLHHVAFDKYFLGVRPDCIVEVRPDILKERDGPTLVHAIQALHGARISVPRRTDLQPVRKFLESRYERFLIFDQKPGYFRESANDQVMEKVDEEGNVLGFSVLHVSALKEKPLEVAL